MAICVAEVAVPVAARKTPDTIRMGQEIESIRRERGLTQQEVADRLGRSLETYRNYAKGYSRLRAESLPSWSRALGLPVPELAGRLRITLLTDADASGLRQELAALLPDATASQVDQYVRDLATLPLSDQKQILDGLRDHIAGRKAHLGLV